MLNKEIILEYDKKVTKILKDLETPLKSLINTLIQLDTDKSVYVLQKLHELYKQLDNKIQNYNDTLVLFKQDLDKDELQEQHKVTKDILNEISLVIKDIKEFIKKESL